MYLFLINPAPRITLLNNSGFSCRGGSTKKERNRETGEKRHRAIEKIRKIQLIGTVGLPEYLSERRRGESRRLIAQAKCGNIEKWERTCDLCGDRFGTLEHLARDCREIEGVTFEDVVCRRMA